MTLKKTKYAPVSILDKIEGPTESRHGLISIPCHFKDPEWEKVELACTLKQDKEITFVAKVEGGNLCKGGIINFEIDSETRYQLRIKDISQDGKISCEVI